VGWGSETAFVREFCALGGRVVKRVALAGPQNPAKVVAQIPRSADGVAVFGSGMSQTPDLLQALARRGAAHLVLGPDVIGDPTLVRGATALRGVVAASYVPSPQGSPEMAGYLRAYARTYPGIPGAAARSALVVDYRSAVEAVLDAFEQTHGDRGARLRERLAHSDAPLLGPPIRMDDHRQAVVTTHLVRLGAPGVGGMPELAPVRSIPGVDQSVGSLVPADYVPTSKGQACRRGTPPPWAG
jgi:ABC-type branched-subunit amino acid transport system substrate-binding protein